MGRLTRFNEDRSCADTNRFSAYRPQTSMVNHEGNAGAAERLLTAFARYVLDSSVCRGAEGDDGGAENTWQDPGRMW